MVKNKKAAESRRLSKEELLVAQEYFKDYHAGGSSFATKWNPDFPLEQFDSFFNLGVIERLLKLLSKHDDTSSSLIPIKGISKVMQAKLRKLYIYDVPTLLIKGKTQAKRNELAKQLDTDVRLVNMWVKQADLWRVDGMTPDTAFLLVQAGVRHVEDLSKLDAEKVYPILERLSLAQPDFFLIDKKQLATLIYNAMMLVAYAGTGSLSLGIETNEKAPSHLFRDDTRPPAITPRSPGEIINEGLGFLEDVVMALALPHFISGRVYMRREGEHNDERRPFPDAMVEVSSIASSTADKTESENNPSGYTDSDGQFIIIMPDNYNMQEVFTITIVQGGNRQKFVRSASDIINAVKEQQILALYDRLDAIDKTTQKEEYEKIKAEILASDITTNNLEQILNNLLSRNDLRADLGEFILTKEIFEGQGLGLKKALPSVKLMGNDDKAVHLSTDTAPSQVFGYSMLQRLVEPAIAQYSEMEKKWLSVNRSMMEEPLDVTAFKKDLRDNPDTYTQMSSLGIGYVLNMHQAWVPDGFALGSLLYSLILAPGEEQRIIVREKVQSYTVADDMEGADRDSQNYALTQEDDTTAAYNYALNQLSQGNSSYDYKTRTSGFGGGFLGLSGSYAKTSGSGSSSASQSNSHKEASTAAQSFQHSIKSASDRISQSKRISVRAATSEVSDSVATKIIANHNHSHTMTIQYWEVMRRYRLETCIEGVELVLFVPLKIIRFLPSSQVHALAIDNSSDFDKSEFGKRYETLIKYADTLYYDLPYQYRSGLNLIKKYNALPEWELEEKETNAKTLTLEFNCYFLSFDDVSVTLVLKNGKGTIAGELSYTRHSILYVQTSLELKQHIIDRRNSKGKNTMREYKCTGIFVVPPGIIEEDFAYIRIDHTCEDFNYTLYKSASAVADSGELASDEYDYMMGKWWDSVKDTDDTKADLRKINYIKQILPEAWISPNVTLKSSTLKTFGNPIVSDISLSMGIAEEDNQTTIIAIPSSSTINSSMYINIMCNTKTLRTSELMEIEQCLHHVLSDAMHYSQVIWASLSENERIMLLEPYTIDMDGFDKISENSTEKKDVPLLNCVNVNKVLGFYGNCMLLPFTYPQSLADKLGKTAAEIQDSLYRYHANCFRVPSTTISLPTDGMIGEAVLGETNVSELIDLTRFWNWQDSPIDSMTLDNAYLNNVDYLNEKTPGTITALNVHGAETPTAVSIPDLITALVAKETPEFHDITGLEHLKDIIVEGTKSAAGGRDKILDNYKVFVEKAFEFGKSGLELAGKGGSDSKDDKTKAEEERKKKIKDLVIKAIKVVDEGKAVKEDEELLKECKTITATEKEVIEIAKAYCTEKKLEYSKYEADIVELSKNFAKKEGEKKGGATDVTPKTGDSQDTSSTGGQSASGASAT